MDKRIKYIIEDSSSNTAFIYITESGKNTSTKEGAWHFDTLEQAEEVIRASGWEEFAWVDVWYDEDDIEEFEEKFEPMYHHNNAESFLFETYGEDLERVRDWKNTYGANHVWTLVEVDGVSWITPGMRLVNRMNYILTKKSWEENEKDYLF
jgi:hypothetical protein